MFGKYLILKLLKIVIIIIWKKIISRCIWKIYFHLFNIWVLDPCHYFSAPGLSWDAMLQRTGVVTNKYMFVQQGKAELVILIKDIVKHLKIRLFSILTWITYMDALWVNIYVLVILSRWKT